HGAAGGPVCGLRGRLAGAVDVRRSSVCNAGVPALSGRGRWRRGSSGTSPSAPVLGSPVAEPQFPWGLARGAARGPAHGLEQARTPGARAAMSRLSVRALRVLTPASAVASLVANAIALCSNSWLHSTELMPNPYYNGSGDREQLAKNTVSGLWKMCFNEREWPRSLDHPSLPFGEALSGFPRFPTLPLFGFTSHLDDLV
ncbi:unnamed protein product, partial [Ixodes pacificus]